MIRGRTLSTLYLALVVGLAITQVIGTRSPWVVLALLLVALPCGLVTYAVQYPLVVGLGQLTDAPQEGSPLLAVLFVLLWSATGLLNIRLASALATRIRTRRPG